MTAYQIALLFPVIGVAGAVLTGFFAIAMVKRWYPETPAERAARLKHP